MALHYGFSPAGGGAVMLHLEPLEHALLLSLAQQLVEFVSPPPPRPDADPLEALVGISPDAAQPDDPALARLLPDAFRDDPASSADFRRYTERGLRETKAANAATVVRALESPSDPMTIAPDDVGAWLGMLNDARLVLGERVGITEDHHGELAALPDDDPRQASLQVYDWLTYLEDSLVHVRLAEIDGDG